MHQLHMTLAIAPQVSEYARVGIDVAVLTLGGRDQLDQGLALRAQLVARRAHHLPRGSFEPLVDVGVHEHASAESARLPSGGDPKIVEIPRGLEHAKAVRERRLAIDCLARG